MTGFMTTKGELVRAILFPPPLDFRFHRDFLRSLYVFLTLGLVGMAYSMYVWIGNGVTKNVFTTSLSAFLFDQSFELSFIQDSLSFLLVFSKLLKTASTLRTTFDCNAVSQ